jgi:predicted DNA-binding ribbon-helix-helix protein
MGKSPLGIYARAKNGGTRSLSYLYWSWIRHIAEEEGVALPQSGSEIDSLTEDESKKLASALRTRAKKIRNGLAARDAAAYVRQIDKQWFPPTTKGESEGTMHVDFDEPDDVDETADFFEFSGGVVLSY